MSARRNNNIRGSWKHILASWMRTPPEVFVSVDGAAKVAVGRPLVVESEGIGRKSHVGYCSLVCRNIMYFKSLDSQ